MAQQHPVHGKDFDRVCRIQIFITTVDKRLLDENQSAQPVILRDRRRQPKGA
jgi:hypothetical protein